MTDFATLGIVIDSSQAPKAANDLDKLTAAGKRTELGLVGGAGAASLAMQGLGTKTTASSIQIRESLVLMREASVGNFTRMAGSASILAGSLATTGQSVGGLAKQLLVMVGILKVTQDAELAEAAAQAAASAASIEAYAQRAAGAIAAADTELALAEAAVRVATTSEAAAAAQVELAAAHEAVAAAAAQATIAENALAVAQGRAAETAAASAAKTVTRFGALGGALIGVGIAVGTVVGGFKVFQAQVRDDHTFDNYAKSLGLSKKEMKELRQEVGGFSAKEMKDLETRARAFEVTWGDVWNGIAKTARDALGLEDAWAKFKSHARDAFISALRDAVATAASIRAVFVAAFNGLNSENAGKSFVQRWKEAQAEGQKEIIANLKTVEDNIIGASKKRIKDAADTIIEDRTAKKPKKVSDHGLADALAELDAQIKGQNALAAAYQVSDAAAIKAEAHQKAEEQAIRHKGEVGLFYERELALAVATRAADGAKIINQLSGQTAAQKAVNDAVADGTITAAQASQQLEDESTLRPLIAAQAVAEGRAKEALTGIIARLRDEQAKSNDEVNRGQVLAATEDANKQIDRLKVEAEQIGATNAVRAKAIALLEAEQFLKDHPSSTAKGSPDYAEAQRHTQEYIKTQIQLAEGTANLQTAQDNYNNSLSYMADLLGLINEQAQTTAGALTAAFGSVGTGVGTALTALTNYAATQAKLDQDHKAAFQAAGSDAAALAKVEILYAKQSATAKEQATLQTLAGLKSLFKEHSTGYKVMSAIEKAYAAFQAVQTAIAIARDIAHTVSSVANSTVRTTANTAEGGSKLFAQLGVWAFPVVAAMVAVIAALGFKGGKGGGGSAPTTADAVQSAQGTGTVLGSANAQSESIAHSLDLTAANTNKMLEYDNQQLRSLRAIETNIGVLATQVAKELQVGGAFDLTGKTGSSSSSGFLGLFGSTTTKSLFDQGLQFNPTMLSDAIANGISGATYQIIEKVKTSSGFLGIGGGTKTSYTTTTGALDPALQSQVGLILGSLRDSVVQAAKVLGFDVQAALNTFQVEIGKISFTDMSADEIQKALEAVFSKVADQMAGFAVSGLEQFQKAGEGLFETLQRLAKDYTTIDVALKSIGKTFGSVGSASIAARESLIALFGSLENFVDETAFYQQNFLTDAQAIAPIQAQVKSTLASLGLSSVDTIAKFNQVVQGIDLTTTAGQQLYASLMALAPAFYQVEQYQEQQAQAAAALAKQKAQLEITLLQAQGKAVEALAAQRKMELAALDPSLRALQEQIYKAQDIASAKDKLSQAYARERTELEATINKFGDLSKSLRDYRDTLFGGGTGGLTYNQALANLIKTGSLSAAGDATALGDLPGVGKSFLDIAKDSAGSLQQYQRDVALVARYVDQGITAADGQVSVAQKQLDTMTAQVGQLIDINTSVLSVKQAIIDLQKLMGGAGSAGTPSTPTTPRTPRVPRYQGSGGGGQGSDLVGILHGMRDRLDDIHDAAVATAGNTKASTKTLKSWDRGGSQAVSTDSDTPLVTTAS